MNLEIRHLATPDDAELAVDLQRAVWGAGEVVAHVMLTAAHNGGLLAGAFVDGILAGFVWGFLGFDDRIVPPRLKHCSHQLGVLPAYRNLGLGFLLKRFQWEFVRAQGLELITWTYDPLLAANAHLNIARLGAVCNTYRENEYGDLEDDLNAGLPTDRFQVDLWVNSGRVAAAMAGAIAGEPFGPASLDDVYWLNPPAPDGSLHPPALPSAQHLPPRLALAIPLDFQPAPGWHSGLSRAWRYAARDAFKALFAAGYTAVDFTRLSTHGGYLLERQPTL